MENTKLPMFGKVISPGCPNYTPDGSVLPYELLEEGASNCALCHLFNAVGAYGCPYRE